MERELAAAVAADGDDRHGLRRAGRGVDNLPDDGVEAIGEAGERGAAAVAAEDFVAKLAAGLLELYRETRPGRR